MPRTAAQRNLERVIAGRGGVDLIDDAEVVELVEVGIRS
jgi:hypothetical protein